MNSDVDGNRRIPDSQLRNKQTEAKVWQAVVLISPAFVQPWRETLFHCPGSVRREFLEQPILWSIPLHRCILLKILHEVQDQCISCHECSHPQRDGVLHSISHCVGNWLATSMAAT